MRLDYDLARAAFWAGASSLTIAAMPAAAQTAATPAAADGLTDIIVTARKVAENLQNVPVSVTAFSGEDLMKQGAVKVQDVANFTPSLTVRPGTASPSSLVLSLRGQVQNDTVTTVDPSVGVYVDGVYWARAFGLNGDLLDLKSVQVLKGPQGTLFGRNTTGGAILFETNDPDVTQLSGNASISYGRFDEFRAMGVVNIPLVSDRVALRLSGQRISRDGYTANVVTPGVTSTVPASARVAFRQPATAPNGAKFDNGSRWSFRGKLLAKPTDTLDLLFSFEYFDMDERAPSRVLVAGFPGYTATTGAANVGAVGSCTPGAATNSCPNTTYAVGTTGPLVAGGGAGVAAGLSNLASAAAFARDNPASAQNNDVPYARTTTYTANFIANLETDWGAVKFIAGYRKVSNASGLDLDGTVYPIFFAEAGQDLKQYSGELQFTGKAFDDRMDFAGGAFAFHEKGSDRSINIGVPTLSAVTQHQFGLIDNDSIGLYGQLSFQVTDSLSFTGGLRYSIDDKGVESRANNYNRSTGATTCVLVAAGSLFLGSEVIGPAQCGRFRRDSFSGVSYTAGIEFIPIDNMMIYAKTARGFRSGGQNLRAQSVPFFLPFAPEVADNYEVGLKSEFLDRRVRLNLAGYYTDVKNIQRQTLVSVPPAVSSIISNAGKARFKGFEGDLAVTPARGLVLKASMSYVDPEYVAFSDFSGDRSFERFRDVSKWQYAVAADYETDIGAMALAANVNWSWTGKQANDIYNFPANPNNAAIIEATTRPSIGLLGASLTAKFAEGRYALTVYGRNILDNRRYTNILSILALGVVTAGRIEPATYGATISAKF
jgi:iron complex outermembrane receptor protein